MWVRSKYAGELAVLSTWLCGLAPWSVTVIAREAATGYFFWFHAFNLLFTPGFDVPGGRPLWVWGFLDFPIYRGETTVTYLWLAGAAVFAVALALSVAYYVDEQRVESMRVDPVRTLGGLLVASGLLLGGAYVLMFQNLLGTSVPVGILLQLVFGVVLVQTERVNRDGDTTPAGG
jgi:uncharacterized protein (TIGR04206 family)